MQGGTTDKTLPTIVPDKKDEIGGAIQATDDSEVKIIPEYGQLTWEQERILGEVRQRVQSDLQIQSTRLLSDSVGHMPLRSQQGHIRRAWSRFVGRFTNQLSSPDRSD